MASGKIPDKNLENFIEILSKCIDPSGISSTKDERELAEFVHPKLKESLCYEIQEGWVELQLEEKFKLLEELKKKAMSTTEPAWRPTTGEINMEPIHRKCLMYKKERLLALIRNKEINVKKLEEEIVEKRKKLDNYSEKILKALNE